MNIVNQQYSSYSQPIGPIVRPKTATGITNYLNQLSPRNSSYGLNNMFQEPNNYYVQQQPQIPVAPPPPPPQQIPVAPTPPPPPPPPPVRPVSGAVVPGKGDLLAQIQGVDLKPFTKQEKKLSGRDLMMKQIEERDNKNRMEALRKLSMEMAMKKEKPQLNTFQRDYFARLGSKNPNFTSKDVASHANNPGNRSQTSSGWSEISSLESRKKSSSKTKKSSSKTKKHPPIPKKAKSKTKKHPPIPKKAKSSSKTKKKKQGVNIAQILGDNPNFKNRKKVANQTSSSVDVTSSSF